MRTSLEDKHLPELDNLPLSVAKIDGNTLTPEIFAKYYQKDGIPVVITGLLDSEPSWDLDYLCEKLGEQNLMK